MQTGQASGMQTMDQSLLALVRDGQLTPETAASYSQNPRGFLQEAARLKNQRRTHNQTDS